MSSYTCSIPGQGTYPGGMSVCLSLSVCVSVSFPLSSSPSKASKNTSLSENFLKDGSQSTKIGIRRDTHPWVGFAEAEEEEVDVLADPRSNSTPAT